MRGSHTNGVHDQSFQAMGMASAPTPPWKRHGSHGCMRGVLALL
ncbi:hypothetical protein BIFGAL_03893 [Bifidobacterium gallicum DSM 20093 = LMG 11596]|uniref:Uncharacterized protein n=1 Tax=Bifidobacterium gallicum DSM 20093 = LMG 11596 TaxID=561180 RepID=D1NVK5_9BIFI|nr:hypothetical protein BIFGAL_03893 [Bifidobacterium gallicum DSM 20093 = LMG 11596]